MSSGALNLAQPTNLVHIVAHSLLVANNAVVADVSRLAPIKEQCPEHITFDQIKVVIAILHRRFGMQVDNDSDVLTASAAVNLRTLAAVVG